MQNFFGIVVLLFYRPVASAPPKRNIPAQNSNRKVQRINSTYNDQMLKESMAYMHNKLCFIHKSVDIILVLLFGVFRMRS